MQPPADTRPEALRVQREIWRRMGPAGRVRAAAEMSQDARELCAAGVRLAHPDWSEARVRRAVLVRIYGAELVERAWGPCAGR